jgi:hypothetical protein
MGELGIAPEYYDIIAIPLRITAQKTIHSYIPIGKKEVLDIFKLARKLKDIKKTRGACKSCSARFFLYI